LVRVVGIKDHEHDIRQFEKASQQVKDAQLRAWILPRTGRRRRC